MRKIILALLLLLFPTLLLAAEPKADKVRLDDAGNYYTSDYVEGSLQEIGAKPFFSISSTNISNWNSAYGWGNHAGLYSLLNHNHDLAYLGLTAKASDSDKLDNHDSTYFQVAGSYLTTESDPVWVGARSGYFKKDTDTLDSINAGTTNVHLTSTLKSNYDSAYSAIHNAVSLDTNADDILSLSTQALGLQTQTQNTVFAGRATVGTATIPTFRSLVALDIPDLSSVYSITGHNHDLTYLGITSKAADSDKLNGQTASYYQTASTNLGSLAGLTFASTSFVKMTSAGTFGLDTNVYVTGTPWTAMGYLTSVTPHNLLSTIHGDTTADTVIRGDIITGQGETPKWARLAFPSTPTGKVLICSATDIGWSSSAIGTAAYTASTAYDPAGAAAAVTPTTLGLVIGTNTQAYDADLTTYAGITPTANAQTLLGETFAQMQASLSIDDLITLSGVAEGSVNLGTFTGTTIADNVTNKAALQALETAVEGKQPSGSYLTSESDPKVGTLTQYYVPHWGTTALANGIIYDNGTNIGIGTTDLDGTPAVGRLTLQGSTNDGSTNILALRDSDGANVTYIDTNGDIHTVGDIYVNDIFIDSYLTNALTVGTNGVGGVEGVITLNNGANPGTSKTLSYTKWADLEAVNGLVKCNGSGDYSAVSGTSSQFVKGDGSLDSSTYLTSLSGAVLTTGNQSIAGIKTFSDATEASSATVGGTVVSGGLAVAKRVYATDMTVKNKITGSISGTADGNALLASSISDADTTHAPDGNSVFDALALKANLSGATFTGDVGIGSNHLFGASSTQGYVTVVSVGLLVNNPSNLGEAIRLGEAYGTVGIYRNGQINIRSDSIYKTVFSPGGGLQVTNFGAGAVTSDASGNLTIASDERLKDIQGNFPEGLKEILAINPILYKYNKLSGLETENIYAGFSAQNVMKYIPEAVGKSPDGYYSFNDRPVIAALVNAVKELQIEIDELRVELKLTKKDHSMIAITNEDKIVKSKPSIVSEVK